MNFIKYDIPITTNNSTINSSSFSVGGGVSTNLGYLELVQQSTNPVDNGVVLQPTLNGGTFGTVTGDTATYLLHTTTGNTNSGWIFGTVNSTSGTTKNIASLDDSGYLFIQGLNISNGNKSVNLIVDVNGNLSIDSTMYSAGDVIAFSDGTGGGSGGSGLISQVYNYANLQNATDTTYLDSDLTNTFNSNAVYQLKKRIVSLEAGTATSINTTGSGNAITSISKSGNVITGNLGGTFLTGINNSQVISALGYTPYNNTNPALFASTGYVDQKITDLIGGAPANLDTLKEIATSLNNNSSLSSSLITSIGTKANQSSEYAYDMSNNNYTIADVHLSLYSDSSNYAVNAGSSYYANCDSDGNYFPDYYINNNNIGSQSVNYANSSNYANSTGYLTTSLTGINSANLIYAQIADNDFFRLKVGGTASNAGYVELATADDGNEPIYFRQYTGTFANLLRTATILDANGNTIFPGNTTINGLTIKNSSGQSVNLIVDSSGKLSIDKDIYSSGEISAYGVGSGGSGSGSGLIQTVYGYSNLGQTFNNASLTDTFNAYSINKLCDRIISLESGSATSISLTGAGNAITSITKSGNIITGNLGTTFSTVGHTHTKSNITDFPTTLSSFTNDLNFSTQNYVDTKVSNLVASSPATLNTLNELANALGDDPNFATTITNLIGTKQNSSTAINTDNIGSQNVSYATSAGNTNTLGSYAAGSYAGYVGGVTDVHNANVPNNYGFFYAMTDSLNNPVPGSWVQGIQMPNANNTDYRQLLVGSGNNLYYGTEGGGIWQPWRKIYDSGNLTNTLTTNYLPQWNGSTLVNSQFYGDGGSGLNIGDGSDKKVTINSGGYYEALTLKNNSNVDIIDLLLSNIKHNTISYIANDGTGLWLNASTATYSTSTTNLGILNNGNILIGTTTDIGAKLQVEGDIFSNGFIGSRNNGVLNGQKAFKIYGFTDGGYSAGVGIDMFNYNGSSYDYRRGLTIKANGNLLIGTTTDNGNKLQVNGNITFGTDLNYNLLSGVAAGGAIQFGVNSGTIDRNLYLGSIDNNKVFTTRLAIMDSGNVLIGSTTDNGVDKLQVNGSSSITGTAKFAGGLTISAFSTGSWIDMPTTFASGIGSGGAGGNAWIAYSFSNNQYFTGALAGDVNYRNTVGSLNFGNSSTQIAMQIKGSNILIGTTTDISSKFSILKSSSDTQEGNQGFALYSALSDTKLQMGTVPGYYSYIQSMQQGTNWSNRPLVLQPNGGNTLIGSVTDNGTGAKLQVNGNITSTGNILASGEISAYLTSDESLKKNIKTIDNSLSIINQLNPVSYNWNKKAKELNPAKTDKKDVGVIAQELEKVLPNLVHNMYDGEDIKGVDYVKLIPYLIGAIKELSTEITELKKQIR